MTASSCYNCILIFLILIQWSLVYCKTTFWTIKKWSKWWIGLNREIYLYSIWKEQFGQVKSHPNIWFWLCFSNNNNNTNVYSPGIVKFCLLLQSGFGNKALVNISMSRRQSSGSIQTRRCRLSSNKPSTSRSCTRKLILKVGLQLLYLNTYILLCKYVQDYI